MRMALYLIIAMTCSGIAQAAPVTFSSSFSRADKPCLEYYVDVLDAAGLPVSGLKADNLSASFSDGNWAGIALEVASLIPFLEIKEPVAFTVLVDISGSMKGAPHTEQIASVGALVEALRPDDRMALISFGDQAMLRQDFTNDKSVLQGILQALAADNQQTVLFQAIELALQINQRGGDFPKRRVIIAMSDGKDEGSGITLDDLTSPLREKRIPVYAFGYTRTDAEHLNTLNRLAGITQGMYSRVMQPSDFVESYKKITAVILGAYVLRLCCPADIPRGPHEIQLTLRYEDRTLVGRNTAVVEWDPVPDAPVVETLEEVPKEPVPEGKFQRMTGLLKEFLKTRLAILIGAGGALCLLCILALLILVKRGRRKKQIQPEMGVLSELPPIPRDRPDWPVQRNDDTDSGISPETGADALNLCLVTISGPDEGKRFSVKVGVKPVTIGRDVHNMVVLNDELVSGHHCDLNYDGERLFITDRKSRNGTKVNHALIELRAVLESGDTFTVGDSELRVVL